MTFFKNKSIIDSSLEKNNNLPNDAYLKIIALKRKRNLYLDDLLKIKNKKLRIQYISRGSFWTFIGVDLVIIGNLIQANSLIIQYLIPLITFSVSSLFTWLNMFNSIQNRKYDNIQKINDIQYELSLCDGYKIKDDIIILEKQSIDKLIKEYITSLNAGGLE